MFCPKCRGEFRADISWCANCDLSLVETRPNDDPYRSPETMAELLQGEKLQVVLTSDQTSLLQIQTKLARIRIATTIMDVPPEYPVPGHFRLVCSSSDYPQAAEMMSTDWNHAVEAEGLGEVVLAAEECPACTSEIPAEAEECPDCGLFVGSAEE